MPDDLDQLLRAAMKHLDAQVPSEYFERLPNRTLERLETSMQTESSSKNDLAAAAPPSDDSGLHDIRSLARSTKQRISANKITRPPLEDDLASSSASWKAVALPEPAKMVSLPALADLPSAAEIKAKDKAAKKAAAKEAAKEAPAPVVAKESVTESVKDAPLAKPAIATAVTPISTARKTPGKSNTGRNVALAGLGLAAAAGIAFVVMNNGTSSSDKAAAPAVAKNDVAAAAPAKAATPPPAPVVEPIKVDDQKPADVPQTAPEPPPVVEAVKVDKVPAKPVAALPKKGAGEHKVVIEDNAKSKAPPPPADTKKPEDKADKKDGKGDPSFDALLKEAGVDDKKGTDKPKLDKKELSAGDITKGMAGATGRAQACFKGTQGTASVRLTVAPSGQVTKVTVSGVFAGKPEAACLQSALSGISFPPWDGGPQSFGYSYLLSE